MADDVQLGEGLRVKLEAIDGVTPPGILESPYYFQCSPLESWGVDFAYTFNDYDTATDGQYSRQSGRSLRTTSFDTLFVDYGSYAMLEDADPIEEQAGRLIELVESGGVFLLTVAHQLPPGGYTNWSLTLAGPELQMPATMRTFHLEERAGEGDARYVSCAFTEWRSPDVGRMARGKGKKKQPGKRTFPQKLELTYDNGAIDLASNFKIKGPVTLSSLAKRYYGDPTQYAQIASANGCVGYPANEPLMFADAYAPLARYAGKAARKALRGDGAIIADPPSSRVTIPRPFSAAITDDAAQITGSNIFAPKK